MSNDKENELIVTELRARLGELVDGRDAALGEALDVQAGLRSLFEHELIRQRRRGRANRAAALEARLASSRGVIAGLDVERQRLAIETREVAEEESLVHGRVRDETGRGLSGLTVCLVTSKGVPLAGVEPVVTDRSGYYALALPGPSQEKGYRRPPKAAVSVLTPAGRSIYRSPGLDVSSGARVVLEVRLDRRSLVPPAPRRPSRPRRAPRRRRRRAPEEAAPTPAVPVQGAPRKPRKKPAKKRTARPAAPAAQRAAEKKKKKVKRKAEKQAKSEARPGPTALEAVLTRMESRRGFAKIRAGRRKLERRLRDQGVVSRKSLEELLAKEERELRDSLRLPNLKAAKAFKRALAAALRKTS